MEIKCKIEGEGVYNDRYFTKKEIVTPKLKIGRFIPVIFLFLAVIFSVGIVPVSADPGVIYVNNATGNNSWDGQSPVYNTTTGSGPKLSLKNATGTVNAGGTVNVADGIYTGDDNRNILITKNMAIIGQSQTGTIIDAQSLSRIFTISSILSITLQNLTVKNGYADNGGAISNKGILTVTDCTFINNTSTASGGGGGAIFDSGDSHTSTVTGCTFTNNTAIKYGGAIARTSGGGLIVNASTFTGNTASTGIIFYSGVRSVTVSFCRFVGNNGYAIYSGSGSIVATNNWWGTNNPDIHILTYGTVGIDPWIVLTVTLDPTSITNGTTQVKADLTRNSRNQDTSTEGHIPDGVPVTFSAENGTINPLAGTLLDGVATALFTAGGQGICVVNAIFDNATASANVNRAPTIDHIGNKVVNENKTITFKLGGHDQDGDSLIYVANDLPAGANFDQNTGIFTWTPTHNQVGIYQVIFKAFDSYSNTTETINITVNDNVVPSVSKVDPAKNTVVKTAKAIKITFSEAIKNGNMSIDLKNSTGKSIPYTISISGNTLTITPKSTLASGKYSLGLHTGALTDLAGNALALYSSSFTVDSTAPIVSKFDPANGATKVAASKTIKVTFSEAIKKGSKFWVDLKNSSGKAIAYTSSINGKVLTIDPKSNLAESLYTLTIHTGAVTDLVGNPVAGKSTKFTVGTAPIVSKIDPKNGLTKVSRSKTIKVTFNEAIKKGSNYKIELKTNNGKSVKITKSISGKTLTIKHTKLAANTKYKLYIYTGSVTDKAGNPIASKTYTFTTGKT